MFVGRNVCVIPCQFKHLVEVIAVPASANDDEHILKLGAFDAVLRLEWRVTLQIAGKGDNFLVRNSPQITEFLQCAWHFLA